MTELCKRGFDRFLLFQLPQPFFSWSTKLYITLSVETRKFVSIHIDMMLSFKTVRQSVKLLHVAFLKIKKFSTKT